MLFRLYAGLIGGLVLLIVACQPGNHFSLPNYLKSPVYSTWAGFYQSKNLAEQETVFRFGGDVRIYINAPAVAKFDSARPTLLVLFALPNGNTIEQTAGKTMTPGADWHYNIQHIAAQTRYLRKIDSTHNYIVAYLEAASHSWPAWKQAHPDYPRLIQDLIDSVRIRTGNRGARIVLNSHSGGGALINGFIESVDSIPDWVTRIAFLDSDYGYNEAIGKKLKNWLLRSPANDLLVLAYNDSIALYNGKPFVSATGGTWWRSKKMARDFSANLEMTRTTDSAFIHYRALNGRLQIILKKNPRREILHTIQVERNGFIHSLLSGTTLEEAGYTYYGDRVYNAWIDGELPSFWKMNFPRRRSAAPTGSAFIQQIESMTFKDREAAVWRQFLTGNYPEFLTQPVSIDTLLLDAAGQSHQVRFQFLPEYWPVGNDSDYCRMPMSPQTAQKMADFLDAALPTRKLVDLIDSHAGLRIEPIAIWPVGHKNELPATWLLHQNLVQAEIQAAGGEPGLLIGGIKKDVVLSNLIADPTRPEHVVIYGWYKLDGQPIQHQTNIHINWYMDYSHGIRFVNRQVFVDGYPRDLLEILQDPVLYRLLDDEDKPLQVAGYPY